MSKTMEEKKKQEKLSYEDLAKNFGELHLQYQKLVQEYQKAMQALQSRDFDYTSFFLSMLFKVMEHPEMYEAKFVDWCSKNIQNSLTSFAEASQPEREEKADAAE